MSDKVPEHHLIHFQLLDDADRSQNLSEGVEVKDDYHEKIIFNLSQESNPDH